MSEKKVNKTIVIGQNTAKQLRETANNENRSESGVIREALKHYMRNK